MLDLQNEMLGFLGYWGTFLNGKEYPHLWKPFASTTLSYHEEPEKGNLGFQFFLCNFLG